MIKKLKSIAKTALFKDSIIYGLTNAFFSGLPLLLMPFLVSVLKPEDYGTVELFRSTTMVLIPIIGLSTVQSITRYYYDLDEGQFTVFISSIIILQIVNTIIALVIVGVLSLFVSHEYIVISFLAVLYYLFNQITEALLSIYRVKRMSRKYLMIRLGSVIADLILLAILYFLLTTYGWRYRVIPSVLATIIFGAISLILLWKNFNVKFQFDKELLKLAITFSAPLILHMLSGYILNVGDRFFITYYLGREELGHYSVAYQIGLAVSFFYTSFNLAWAPTFFEWMKQEKFEAIRKVRILVYIILPIIGGVALLSWILISKYIHNLSRYNVKLELVIIITVAYIIISYYKFNSNYYFYYKQTKVLSIISFTTGVVCVILYMILIPKLGILGAAISTLITFIIMFVCTYIFKPDGKNLMKANHRDIFTFSFFKAKK